MLLFAMLFAAGFAVTALSVPLFRRIALAADFVDRPGARKKQEKPVPYLGGAAVLLGVAAAVGISLFWTGVRPYVESAVGLKIALVLAGGLAVFVVGLVDDRVGLSPLTKVLLEVLAAIWLVAWGIRGSFLVPNAAFGAVATVLWIVLVTNAFNFLDTMDGLCGGVSAIAAAVFAVVCVRTGQHEIGIPLAALSGALVGFLVHNCAPAGIYLGDAGSLWIGYLFAGLTIVATFYRYEHSTLRLAMPLLIVAVPLFDTVTAMTVRVLEKRSPFVGDCTSHFPHRLLKLGMTRRETVLTIYLVAAVVGAGAIYIGELREISGMMVLGQAVGVFAVIALLIRAGSRREENGEPLEKTDASAGNVRDE